MILYKLLKNTNTEMKEAYGKYYAYPVITKTVNINELANQMAEHNTGFSVGQVKGLLADMVKRIKENILNGFAVKIDDLAIFTCGIINKEGAESKAQFKVMSNVESVKLRARSTGELTRAKLNLDATLKNVEKLTKLSISSDDGGDDENGEHITTPTTPSDDQKDNPSGGSGSSTNPGESSDKDSGTDPDKDSGTSSDGPSQLD